MSLYPISKGIVKSTWYEKLKIKGTGTRDLIWLKVVSLDRSWLVHRAYRRPLKYFKVLLYIFNKFFKKFSGNGKKHAY